MAAYSASSSGGVTSDAWPQSWNTESLNRELTLGLLLVASALVIICREVTKRKRKRGLPPGPVGLPLLGYLPFLRSDLHRCFAELARTHGPVMRLQLGARLCVVISSPDAAREVLKEKDAVFANRTVTVAARAITFGGRDLFFNDSGPGWRALRKASVRELFNAKRLDAVYGLRRREVRHMAAELRQRAGTPVDVGQVVFETMLNVVTGMIWGGMEDREENNRLSSEFRRLAAGIMELLGTTNVSDLLPWMAWFDVQGVERRMKGFAATADCILSKIIEQRVRFNEESCGLRSNNDENQDFLQVMLEVLERADPREPLTVDNIKALFLDMVVGGTDTTSATVEWVIAEMLHKPEIMEKAHKELDMVVGTEGIVEECHLPKLHYLEAVLKEALRLHPPILPPHCPSETSNVGGYRIPKGTQVFINAWAIHRDPGVWDDPLVFKPERFLIGTQKWDHYGVGDCNFIPFGSGRRICVAIALAERMTMWILATLLYLFDWQLDQEDHDLSEKFGLVLKKAKPLHAIPALRFPNQQHYE